VTGRREWLRVALLGAGGAAALSARRVRAQQPSPGIADTSNLFAMDQSAARSARLPPKPGARPSMTPAERDQLEHRIRCQCGCTLSVYVCRTTDFSCQVSPAMHRDIMALVQGGYTAPEIRDAFVSVYGERALMEPTKEGFNVLAWVLPGSAIAIGAVVLAFVLRGWRRRPQVAMPAGGPALDASPEELARLEAAVRDDS